jgi:zinc protease
VFGSEEYYAASVCGAILGMQRGSRLYRTLVRERQVAAEVSAFTFDLATASDLLIVDVTARPGVEVGVLEGAAAAEIDRMHREGVGADEVSRAVALITTDLVAALQSAGERADKMSQYATYFGDASRINEQVDRYRGVTAQAVSAFARARLGENNRASLLYVPRTPAAADQDGAMAGVEAGA